MTIEIATSTDQHPLEPLTVAEITRIRELLSAADQINVNTRFSYVQLREPAKQDLLAGESVQRIVDVVTTDLATLESVQFLIDLDSGLIERERRFDHATHGSGPMFDEDFANIPDIVNSDPRWVDALARRGVTDLSLVRTPSITAGYFGFEEDTKARVARVVAWKQDHAGDIAYAHPVDGIVAHVDLTNKKVIRVIESDITHVPAESGNYLDPQYRGPDRTTLKPISITQPEGVSFSLEEGHLRWENWDMRVGFNSREGLTLHQISLDSRPVIYRASVPEMVVNYGDPEPTRNWQNYFDMGESRIGASANSLKLGCDCLGEIRYVDAVLADDLGNPMTIENAICIHEEDYGILWKHTDPWSNSVETRRQRRLVVSFFSTVGNYDYGLYWYFYLDGTIQLEAKATGIVATTGHRGGDYPYSPEIAPGLGAPAHQHLFCARIDPMIDGIANFVEEVEFRGLPIHPDDNVNGNAITRIIKRFKSEKEAVRDADGKVGRTWKIGSAERNNRMGKPTAFTLHPEGKPLLLADPDSSVAKRAAFARHHLWVTRFDADQQWPAGLLVNQSRGGGGLPSYIEGDRPIDGADIVVWHVFGLTHWPRLEDYPVMPVEYTGFTLTPNGFFDRNPTLDVPASLDNGHCSAEMFDREDSGRDPHGSCAGHHTN
ncbi:primary-amine oxidase [Nocardia sp. NPDC059246]|uniref:primary-amine oxidase n=1 Tax=unclassified Nocardia TaxID=2637762 RepID=UPI003688FC26